MQHLWFCYSERLVEGTLVDPVAEKVHPRATIPVGGIITAGEGTCLPPRNVMAGCRQGATAVIGIMVAGEVSGVMREFDESDLRATDLFQYNDR